MITIKFLPSTRRDVRKLVRNFHTLEKKPNQSTENSIQEIVTETDRINNLSGRGKKRIDEVDQVDCLLEGISVTDQDYAVFNPIISYLDTAREQTGGSLEWGVVIKSIAPVGERLEARIGAGSLIANAASYGEEKKQGDCRDFTKKGKCRFNKTCHFNHNKKARAKYIKDNSSSGGRRSLAEMTCYSCQKKGHISSSTECPNNIKANTGREQRKGKKGKGKKPQKKKKKKKDKCREGDKCSYVTYEQTDTDSSSSYDSDSESSNYSSMFTHVAYYAASADAADEHSFIAQGDVGRGEKIYSQHEKIYSQPVSPQNDTCTKNVIDELVQDVPEIDLRNGPPKEDTSAEIEENLDEKPSQQEETTNLLEKCKNSIFSYVLFLLFAIRLSTPLVGDFFVSMTNSYFTSSDSNTTLDFIENKHHYDDSGGGFSIEQSIFNLLLSLFELLLLPILSAYILSFIRNSRIIPN
jgi:hypothetical protein